MNNYKNIDNIIKRFKYDPESLKMIIKSKRNEINYMSDYYDKWTKYDIEVLEKALKEIKILEVNNKIVKYVPLILGLYYLYYEIHSIINTAQLNFFDDIYIFVIIVIKSILIFFILPIYIFEKAISYCLALESLFPIELVYKPLYAIIFLLLVIRFFESLIAR